MLQGYPIFDADAHGSINPSMWEDLPEQFRARGGGAEYAQRAGGVPAVAINLRSQRGTELRSRLEADHVSFECRAAGAAPLFTDREDGGQDAAAHVTERLPTRAVVIEDGRAGAVGERRHEWRHSMRRTDD